MDHSIVRIPLKDSHAQERELQLIREAIAFVARGSAVRIVVANLRLGEYLLVPGRQLAAEAGVRLVPLRRTYGPGVDIAIEPCALP